MVDETDEPLKNSADDVNTSLENNEEYDEALTPSDDMRERRYLWIARVFAVFSAVSLCTNIILLIAIGNLVPLNRVEPYLIDFQNKSDQIVKVEKLKIDANVYNIIAESLVRDYVRLRNTVLADEEEMARRWGSDGLLKWISGELVYDTFISGDGVRLMQRMLVERYTQAVTITSVSPIRGRGESYWQVRFVTSEMVGDSVAPVEQRWVATIFVKSKSNRNLAYSDRIKNPLGLEVDIYTAEKEDVAGKGL